MRKSLSNSTYCVLPDPQKFTNIFNNNNKKKSNKVLTKKLVCIVKLKQCAFLVTALLDC